MSEELLQYVEPIFRFCLKRLSSRTDAEDLSQEILLCVLQGLKRGNISNLTGYVWQVAHNRYARTIQTRNSDPIIIHGYEYLTDISDAADDDDSDEISQSVFNALHTLSSMYRDILVDYYVRNFDTYIIAERYGITVETVKWRLHAGREKIRERMKVMERNYERIKMHLLPNGSFEIHKYLGSQTQKAIAKACYDSPLSLEEISLSTGIPTLYLEDTLEEMVWGDAIEKIGSKFATNFIITPCDKVNNYLTDKVVSNVTDVLLDYVKSTESELRQIRFYGNHFPLSHLLHIMIPKIILEKSDNTGNQSFPPHKDGGFGWYIIHEGIETLDWRFSDVQGYKLYKGNESAGRFTYFWVGDTVNKDLIKFLMNEVRICPPGDKSFSISYNHDDGIAKAVSLGIIKNVNGEMIPAVPMFYSEDEYSRFNRWAQNCDGIKLIWDNWIDALKSTYKSFTPKRLSEQIIGNRLPAQPKQAETSNLKRVQKKTMIIPWQSIFSL